MQLEVKRKGGEGTKWAFYRTDSGTLLKKVCNRVGAKSEAEAKKILAKAGYEEYSPIVPGKNIKIYVSAMGDVKMLSPNQVESLVRVSWLDVSVPENLDLVLRAPAGSISYNTEDANHIPHTQSPIEEGIYITVTYKYADLVEGCRLAISWNPPA